MEVCALSRTRHGKPSALESGDARLLLLDPFWEVSFSICRNHFLSQKVTLLQMRGFIAQPDKRSP